MQDLDILNLPLRGIRLIEASAGTGKTYNLVILYLRLLLHLGNQSAFSHPLTIKEILVVTFTKSAVQKLRERIREGIRKFRLDCIHGYSNNHLFSKLLLQIYNVDQAITLLSIAEKEIDQASIFTIHGFCQRILVENTIELNVSFYTSIIEDESTLYQQICTDFWRRHFYSLPLNIVNFIQQYWKNPEELLKDISPYIYGEIPKFQHFKFIYESNIHIPTHYTKIITCISAIKKQWIAKQNDIINNIYTYTLNRKIYNKKNLIRWINTVNQWTKEETVDHSIPNHLKRFRSSVFQVNEHLKKTYIFFLFNSIEELYQLLSSFKVLIFNIAINEVRQNLHKTRHSRSEITFNDLIDLLLHSDIQNKNNKLVQKILKCYPVAIIDEFQDTDSYQYKIFYILYSNCLKNSLILIGDPKQAIYGFRGADIFTYMQVRRSLQNKYNLNINWRSSPGIVNAINQLFRISNPFIFKDIPFIPSIPAHQNRMYRFLINNKPQPSMCFWLHPDNTITINDYKIAMAKECAITIQNLLSKIHNKTVWLENNKYKRKILNASDITILVRNHIEASLIQSELLKINISAVFLSNRKNIFETIEAYELLLLLQAILFPKRNTICTALTTIFFGLNAMNIESINNNEFQWEQMFEEFSEYYSIWKNYGILSMIQKIIFRYKVPEILLSMKKGQNNLINILHLGELLNNISKQLKTEYELIQWLELKTTQPHNQYESSDYALRFNDDDDLIKISTIHKSKGLEFPLIFLPFIASFNSNKKKLFTIENHLNYM